MTSGFDAFSLGLFTSLAPAGGGAVPAPPPPPPPSRGPPAPARSWHSRSCGSGRATARPQCASTA